MRVDYLAVLHTVAFALARLGCTVAAEHVHHLITYLSQLPRVTRAAVDAYVWHAGDVSIPTSRLLSAPGKMPGASFSLPAGASCPASKVAQRDAESDGTGDRTVCGSCYAMGGFYRMPNVARTLADRFAFVRASLREDGGSAFIAALAVAIACEAARDRASSGESTYLFRVHDSGDLFSDAYAMAWGKISDVLPNVRFWIPTREYYRPTMRAVLQLLAIRPNVALRPSAIFAVGRAPDLTAEGFAPGTGVAATLADVAPDAYVCPATVPGNVPTCEANGCRMCWSKAGQAVPGYSATARALPVVYLAH